MAAAWTKLVETGALNRSFAMLSSIVAIFAFMSSNITFDGFSGVPSAFSNLQGLDRFGRIDFVQSARQ
jgi:hypothetical protein